MSRITMLFKLLVFFLLQIILLIVVKAEQDTLNLKLRDDDGNGIVLTWQKTNQLLVNKHMPFWIAHYEVANGMTHEFIPNFIAEMVGNFILYQDVVKSSAVVYVEHLNCLYGNIGNEYIIDGLPLVELKRKHNLRGSKYVKKREHVSIVMRDRTEIVNHPSDTFSYSRDKSNDNQMTVLYPEILVLVTNDLLQAVQQKDPARYLAYLAIQYIAYFNTIDMLFKKLSTDDIKIHINIAGIIIEGERDAFPFTRYPQELRKDGLNHINSHQSLTNSIPQYLRSSGFTEDSFDIFFVSTGAILHQPLPIYGFSTPPFDIYSIRKLNIAYKLPKYLGTIMQYSDSYPGHVIGAHRIAGLMSIDSSGSIEWSQKSVRDLNVYVSKNRNHCFLLNYPRSLHPFGRPVLSRTASDQCICYGYGVASMEMLENGEIDCNKNSVCEHADDSFLVRAILPIDGTPCSSATKVCWQKTCQYL